MKTKVARWGRSLGIRIPTRIAEDLAIHEGAELDLSVRRNEIRVKKPRFTLEALVADITPQNRHGAVDWGAPVGKEVW